MLIVLRGPVWRVRILIHGDSRIRWRAYRVAEYPTPEAVAQRCAEGLTKSSPNDKTDDGQLYDNHDRFRPVHGLPLRVRWECWGRL